ncbi:MAG TPA: response regulator [Hyphomonadaceae bacterium]|nr:response regulator [Hyphomonadaceae bacterium]HPN05173.1 response regulator [Hyphomonadaceae bacterium]
MKDSTDASVVVCTHFLGIARTVRMALRGMKMRDVQLAANQEQLLEAFQYAEPDCIVLYVDSDHPDDEGLSLLNFIRRDKRSPNHQIPVVVISPRRDLPTINAVMNGGAHEYVLFPAAGEALLRKVVSACANPRAWIERADYVGPERKTGREPGEAIEAGEKTAV